MSGGSAVSSAGAAKKKQMILIFSALFGFVGLLVLGMWLSDPNKGKPSALEVAKAKAREVTIDFTADSSDAVTAKESWIAMSERELEIQKAENQELRNQLGETQEMLSELMKRFDEERQGKEREANDGAGYSMPSAPPMPGSVPVIDVMEGETPAQALVRKSLPAPPSPAGGVGGNRNVPVQNVDRTINVISLDLEEKSEVKNIESYLPSGTFGTVVLLSGVDAPTGGAATTNPMPVLMRLKNDGKAANFWESGVRDCHVTGAAHGDISSERVLIRLEILTCVLESGEIVETSVKGYVAGEDGKAGFRGIVRNKQGALIARSLLAGIAGGFGNSVNEQYQQVSTSALGSVTSVDPGSAVERGLATGTSNALEKIADFYIARANEIYPIIEVDANRIGEIVLLSGSSLGVNIINSTREYEE